MGRFLSETDFGHLNSHKNTGGNNDITNMVWQDKHSNRRLSKNDMKKVPGLKALVKQQNKYYARHGKFSPRLAEEQDKLLDKFYGKKGAVKNNGPVLSDEVKKLKEKYEKQYKKPMSESLLQKMIEKQRKRDAQRQGQGQGLSAVGGNIDVGGYLNGNIDVWNVNVDDWNFVVGVVLIVLFCVIGCCAGIGVGYWCKKVRNRNGNRNRKEERKLRYMRMDMDNRATIF
eukprot:104153_1